VLFKLMRRTDLDRTLDFIAWLMRKIGPWLRGQRVARANLVAAYPEKSAAEIKQILSGMWDNLGRLGVEYANLDRMVDDESRRDRQRVVYAPGGQETLERLRDDGKPALLFTAHLANYEVGAIASTHRLRLPMAVLYRRPNLGPITDYLLSMRASTMGEIIEAGPDSVWKIRDALKRGRHVAILVDQHFAQGVEVQFFGRPCKVNPMPARFAGMFNCPVHGARSIRLPGNRIAVELTDELKMPRGSDGKIDVQAAMQMMTTIIEGWVREHPEQWPWLQRRWR